MKEKILLIDDNENFLKSTQDILEERGYQAVALNDPVKTEEYIKKEKPDLLIIDVCMPQRSGFNILQDFKDKNIYQDIPKIFLTVLDDPTERMVADSYGVKEFIAKPFDPAYLISKIKKCLLERKADET